jgi:ribokinase
MHMCLERIACEETMAGQIVVIGSSNVDFIMKMRRLPQRGETITDANFLQTFGGKGANQAMAAARAGGRVSFVNCVGDDSHGAAIVQNMREAGADVRHVWTETGVASGTALVMIGEAGDNYLSVAPGANYRLTPEHVDRAAHSIAEAALIMLQCEIPPDTLDYVFRLAISHERPMMLNLAPARAVPEWVFPHLAYLIVNESEAAFLCGKSIDSVANATEAIRGLRDRGPQVVAITLGSAGAVLCSADGIAHLPAFPVEAIDATAAGDVFCGAMAVALVEGLPLQAAARFASAASAICVTRFGAQPSIPTRQEIDLFLHDD